jgi:peptide/nickel transport system permease protein
MVSHEPTQDRPQRALAHLKAGRQKEAAAVLAAHLRDHPGDGRAWHMLSYAVEERKQQIYALGRAVEIDPGNRAAASRLRRLAAPQPRPEPLVPAGQGAREVRTQPRPGRQARPRRQAGMGGGGGAVAAAQTLAWPAMGREAGVKHSLRQRLAIKRQLWWQRFRMDWRAFSESPLAILGLVLIVLFALMALAHPILMQTVWPSGVYDPVTGYDMEIFDHPSLPGPGHLLGTDTLGRDVLSMLLAATTPTFVLGLTAALMTAAIGTVLSVIAAYFRGAVDAIITNLADVFLLFPAPIIMVIIGARFRELQPWQLGLIYGFVTGAGPTVIVMRAHGLQVVSRPYMEAAQIAGGGAWHIIAKHMLPAMLPLAALQMMIAVTGAVVADGFISFFGLTRVSSNWGTIIYNAFVYSGIGSSDRILHMLLPAAICFSLFALGFYLVSRGLHRVASPTVRRE